MSDQVLKSLGATSGVTKREEGALSSNEVMDEGDSKGGSSQGAKASDGVCCFRG